MVNFIRAAALQGFGDLAREGGADPVRLCAAVGIPASALSTPDVRIRSDAFAALLDLTARQTGMDDLGLRLGASRRPSNWGVAGLMMTLQKTVGEALRYATRLIAAHAEGITTEIEAFGDEVVVWVDIEYGEGAIRFDPAQRSELVIEGAVHVLAGMMQRDWKPERVGFTHAAWGDLNRYRPYFGRIPDFNQDRQYYVATAADFNRPLPSYDPEGARLMRDLAEQQLPESEHSFSRAVALTISQRLVEGPISAEAVAGALDLDLRALQRRLAAEGSSFSELLYAVRKELARTYVEGSSRPLAEVAELLGFASLSAFSQWYTRAHGQSAAERRAARH